MHWPVHREILYSVPEEVENWYGCAAHITLIRILAALCSRLLEPLKAVALDPGEKCVTVQVL